MSIWWVIGRASGFKNITTAPTLELSLSTSKTMSKDESDDDMQISPIQSVLSRYSRCLQYGIDGGIYQIVIYVRWDFWGLWYEMVIQMLRWSTSHINLNEISIRWGSIWRMKDREIISEFVWFVNGSTNSPCYGISQQLRGDSGEIARNHVIETGHSTWMFIIGWTYLNKIDLNPLWMVLLSSAME